MPIKVGYLTIDKYNVGDNFIREGISAILDAMEISHETYIVDKLKESSLTEPVETEIKKIKHKYFDMDVFIQSGAPVYWYLVRGASTSLTSDWYDWFWKKCVF